MMSKPYLSIYESDWRILLDRINRTAEMGYRLHTLLTISDGITPNFLAVMETTGAVALDRDAS